MPCRRTRMTWTTITTPMTKGSSATCHNSICPALKTLNQAPMPT
jgi:hypothetical protein